MGIPSLIGLACALAGCGRLGFDALDAARDADADAADGPAVIGSYQLTYSTAFPGEVLGTIPFDAAGFGAPCPLVPAGDDYRLLAPHPTRPYVYGVDSWILGVDSTCLNQPTLTTIPSGGLSRPRPGLVLHPSLPLAYFTVDGLGEQTVVRASLASDGVPNAIVDTSPGPLVAEQLAIAADKMVVVGLGELMAYELGADGALGDPSVIESPCVLPTGIVVGASRFYITCEGVDGLLELTLPTLTPVGNESDLIGAVALDPARFAAIRPTELLVVSVPDLMVSRVALPSTPIRITASLDGAVIGVAMRSTSDNAFEIYRSVDLTLIDRVAINGSSPVLALAINAI